MVKYTLPELSYDYAALEPHISREIMQLHHDKHHRAYVDGANKAVEALIAARESDDFSTVPALERALAFHVSGHVLHSIFWRNLSPKGGGRPAGELGRAIERDFGSFEAFQKQMTETATTIMGSGWAALVFDPISGRLGTTQIHDHQSEVTQGGLPLMVIDAWEHAYYLQYKTQKADYFKALWNLWDWDDVSERLARASTLDLALGGADRGAVRSPRGARA
ncbi:MAG TPA: superoxide dismutase [Polyangia bacterium]|nr:superoxide dismutase [Polyangia bacterium]